VWSGVIQDKGAACVCGYPNGRDDKGACGPCANGYLKKPDGGAQSFHNGEFHCAPGNSSSAILV